MSNFITENRALDEAIHLSESKLDIECTYFFDGWLVRLKKGSKTRFIFGYCFDINSEAAGEVANDKAATYEVLKDSDIAAVPHYLMSSVISPKVSLSDLEGVFKKHESIVLKPKNGNKGEMVAKFDDPQLAIEYTEANPKILWVASQYLDIAREIRIVVLNGSAKLACEKINPVVMNGLKMYNLSLGAKAVGLELSDVDNRAIELAEQSMEAIGLNMGAVDIVFDHAGRPYVLEINNGFSLERFALSSEQARNEVVNFYELAIEDLFKNNSTR
jgi:glutathione synthase/RimK-type ligase-like ATP-grasp enzyme